MKNTKNKQGEKEIKHATGEVCDYIVVSCPYCDFSIEEYWGRINDMTITGPESGEEFDCTYCEKTFILDLE